MAENDDDTYDPPDDGPLLARGWAPYLVKASQDPFTYAIGLRTGLVILCAEVDELPSAPGWIAIRGVSATNVPIMPNDWGVQFGFDRGLHVRLTDIVWVADAPYGS